MDELSHIDESGRPAMVDIGGKQPSKRSATAQTIVVLPPNISAKILSGDIMTSKGAVFQTAIIAGIMAAKKTGELIPLCHPIGLDNCSVTIKPTEKNELVIECTATVEAKTGVEMEALVGASIAALTVYDMCKALSHDIIIKETKLVRKTGGKKDFERK